MSATKYGWNEWDKPWTGGNEMKYGQWNVEWMKWDEIWTITCGLKEIK